MKIVDLQIEIFLLLLIGYLLAKKGYFASNTQAQMTNIVLMVVLPCSIVKSFQIDVNREKVLSTVMVLAISFGIQLLYGLLNQFLYQSMPEGKKACCQYATMVSNAGFMGMPIAQGVFGDIGLTYTSVFLIPQRIFMWSSGLKLFAGAQEKHIARKVLMHPCIVAIYIGVVLMVLRNFDILLPHPVEETIALISQCNTALSMLVIGGILSEMDYRQVFTPFILKYSFFRLIAIPLLIMGILRMLPVPALVINLCTLLSAMPAASTTAMLAQKYHGDALFASQLIFVSTVFSMFTLPLITLTFA